MRHAEDQSIGLIRVDDMTNNVTIPEKLLPEDGRFGSGPSKIRHDQISELSGDWKTILGTSHRQAPVKRVVASIKEGLRELFGIPDGYEIALGNGGSTAFWDMACACLINRKAAFGVYGSFTRKFADCAAKAPFLDQPVIFDSPLGTYALPQPTEGVDAYCWAHNETSTGVNAPVRRIAGPQVAPEGIPDSALTIVDGTSAAGAIEVDISQTDVYYFSPQKAFGAEGGIWFAILSPAAIERANQIEQAAKLEGAQRWVPSFLSLTKALDNARKDQTLNTPSVGNFILIDNQIRWLNENGGLAWSTARCSKSASIVYDWAERVPFAQPFVKDPESRSHSVATIDMDEMVSVDQVLGILRQNGIVDVSGYRGLHRNQLRIGVFPSVEPRDVEALLNCVDYVVAHM